MIDQELLNNFTIFRHLFILRNIFFGKERMQLIVLTLMTIIRH
jgi:hypothetical protein